MIKTLRRLFPIVWYLVDLQDEYVAYIGTYRECNKVIDELAGGNYAILKKSQLTDSMLKSVDILLFHQGRT
jgi:hypothetical protein